MWRAPGVQVVALVPVAGPGAAADERRDAAGERLVDLLRADEVDVRVDAAGGEDQAFAGDRLGRHADDHARRHAGHHVRVAGLADAGDAAVLDADVGLVDAGPVDDQRVGDDAVERLGVGDAGRLAHAVAQHLAAAELALVAVDGVVALDLGDEAGVAEAHAVAGGRAVDVGVVLARDAVRHGRSPGATNCWSRRGATVLVSPGSNRTAVPAGMSRRMPRGPCAVEVERAVGLDEVIVAADLDRPVAAVGHRELGDGAAGVQLDLAGARRDRAGRLAEQLRRACRSAPPASDRQEAAVERERQVAVLARRSDGGRSRAWCRRGTCLRPALRRSSRPRRASRRRGRGAGGRGPSARRRCGRRG